MSSGEDEKQVKSDEEWKERVRAEAEQLDAQSQTAAPTTGEDATQTEPQSTGRPQIEARHLPPANLSTLISMLGTQAMVALGVLPDPSTGEAESQPALAKHFIDLLGVIEEKTKENLTIDEQRMLNSSLHELRMAFVQITAKR